MAIATTLSVFGLTLFDTHPAQSATFKYTTAVGETIYTENSTNVNGANYDGTFVNSIFDPFAQTFREFSGFFVITRGSSRFAPIRLSSLQAQLNLIFSSFGAPVAGSPTVVSRGWSVERIPEPNIVLALALLSGSGMLFIKKLRRI